MQLEKIRMQRVPTQLKLEFSLLKEINFRAVHGLGRAGPKHIQVRPNFRAGWAWSELGWVIASPSLPI